MIIGGGASGLSAAVTAVEAGAGKVVVIESRPAPGGNALYAGGIMGAETDLQRRLGFDVSRDDLFRSMMTYGHWKPNAMLVRCLVDMAGDNIRWLEAQGLHFNALLSHYPNQALMTFHTVAGPQKAGAMLVKTLLDTCKRLKVQILCDTAAKRLVMDDKGCVSGVLAEGKDGSEIRVGTRCAVIATGGFAGNEAMLRKYIPFYNGEMALRGMPHRGDGIQMAAEAGAAVGGVMALEAEGPACMESRHGDILAKRPDTIWVNRSGRRFADEHSLSMNEAANAMFNQPGKMSFTLLDEKIKKLNIDQVLNPFESCVMDNEKWQKGAEQEIDAQVQAGHFFREDSWSGIAARIGADPGVLQEAVEAYNQACARGRDGLFLKDPRFLIPLDTPPYYAIPAKVQLLVTHGGIRVNDDLAVLDTAEQPIAGLFAAGDDTNGRLGDTYNIRLSGMSMCFAVGSGRLAGKNATVYLKALAG